MLVSLNQSVLVVNHDAVVSRLTEPKRYDYRLGLLLQPVGSVAILLRARQTLGHVLRLHWFRAQYDLHTRLEEEDAEVLAQRRAVLWNVFVDGSNVFSVDFLALRIQNILRIRLEIQLQSILTPVSTQNEHRYVTRVLNYNQRARVPFEVVNDDLSACVRVLHRLESFAHRIELEQERLLRLKDRV